MASPVFFSAYPTFPISSFPLTCSCAPKPQRKHSCKLFLWGKEQGGHTPPSQPKRVCFRGLIAPEQRSHAPHVVVPLLPWRSVASTEGLCPVLRPVRHPWAPLCSVLAQKIGWRIFIYIFWLVKKAGINSVRAAGPASSSALSVSSGVKRSLACHCAETKATFVENNCKIHGDLVGAIPVPVIFRWPGVVHTWEMQQALSVWMFFSCKSLHQTIDAYALHFFVPQIWTTGNYSAFCVCLYNDGGNENQLQQDCALC